MAVQPDKNGRREKERDRRPPPLFSLLPSCNARSVRLRLHNSYARQFGFDQTGIDSSGNIQRL